MRHSLSTRLGIALVFLSICLTFDRPVGAQAVELVRDRAADTPGAFVSPHERYHANAVQRTIAQNMGCSPI
jgi:hypothetical protein